ncbi:MAG: porin family protein [Alphaproteobacteria bacterium]|nr:porin family protein [Alphaproteobacteria bacterium]
MKKILLTTAAVLCFALPAFAQEITKEQETTAPMLQNSYLAVRLGGSRLNMKMNGEKEDDTVFSLSAAIGTKIADGVRAELEAMTYGTYEETEIDGTDYYNYKHSAVNFSINVLKDFDFGKMKPYIGAGVGFAVFYDELKYDFTDSGWHYWGSNKENNSVFSANLQAGFAFAIAEKVSIDVNARYTHFSSYKFFEDTLKIENKAVNFTAGLRLDF